MADYQQQSPYDELILLPGQPIQQPAYFWRGANQWPDPVLVTTHYTRPPLPKPTPIENNALGLQGPPITRRGIYSGGPDNPSTQTPWYPAPMPSYGPLRAPKPQEAWVGPQYNPGEPLGLIPYLDTLGDEGE